MSHNLIIESCIFSEAQVVKQTPTRAIFRCPLQSCNDVNQNKRLYPQDVLEEGMKGCDSRINRRAFYGELDHPLPTGNHQVDGIRQTSVLLKEVSHLIRTYEFRGNILFGEMETSSTPNGNLMLGLLKDKTGLGFSMRGMAEVQPQSEGYNLIKGPMTIITYDAVGQPSHQNAVVNFNEMTFESHMLTESSNGLCCVDGKCFMPDYFDKLVETKMIKFFGQWV